MAEKKCGRYLAPLAAEVGLPRQSGTDFCNEFACVEPVTPEPHPAERDEGADNQPFKNSPAL